MGSFSLPVLQWALSCGKLRFMKKLPFGLSARQLILIAAIVVVGFMLMDLNTRLMELSRISEQRELVQTDVNSLISTRVGLETEMAYAESDKAVEEWARQDAHMARPGDNVIIPLPPQGVTPVPPPAPTITVKQYKNWEVWYMLFFGEE